MQRDDHAGRDRNACAGSALAELREKYEEILRLRTVDDARDRDERELRATLARLASRWPGALRELDSLPLCEIEARIERLRAAERDAAALEPWMRALALFHERMRGALAVKRWLTGRRAVTPDLRAAFARDLPGLPHADDARAWADHLHVLATPPRGRVSEAVVARIAVELDLSGAHVRLLLFGVPRRAR